MSHPLLSAATPQCYERHPFRRRQRVCRVEPFVIQQLGRSWRPASEGVWRKTINWNIPPTSTILTPLFPGKATTVRLIYLPKKMRRNHIPVGLWTFPVGCLTMPHHRNVLDLRHEPGWHLREVSSSRNLSQNVLHNCFISFKLGRKNKILWYTSEKIC